MKKHINILVIDDNEIDRFITISNVMAVFGHINLFESTNAIEALNFLETAKSNFPNLILVDINMPVMNGFMFMERYEELYGQKHPQSLVYLITSSNDRKDIIKANEFHSVTGYFTKPFDQSKVKKLRESHFNSYKPETANQ